MLLATRDLIPVASPAYARALLGACCTPCTWPLRRTTACANLTRCFLRGFLRSLRLHTRDGSGGSGGGGGGGVIRINGPARQVPTSAAQRRMLARHVRNKAVHCVSLALCLLSASNSNETDTVLRRSNATAAICNKHTKHLSTPHWHHTRQAA